MADNTSPFREQLHAALEPALRAHPDFAEHGAMISKWVVVAEAIDGEDGERYLITCGSPGLSLWDSLGMLRYPDSYERSRIEIADN